MKKDICFINDELYYFVFSGQCINGQLCNDIVEEWSCYIEDFYDDLFNIACDEYCNKFLN